MTSQSIGRLLRPFTAGVEHTAGYHSASRSAPETITVTSSAFQAGRAIPLRYAGKGLGDNVSPPLAWEGISQDSVELVIVIEDPDVPLPRPVVHGLFTGIAPSVRELPAGALNLPCASEIQAGYGSFRGRGYAGPRPIPGHGPHRYIFQVFALDSPSGLDEHTALRGALRRMRGHVIGRGELVGTYERT